MESEFKLVERGFKETLVLIPGWASDYRIFNSLELDYNYILPVKFLPFDFTKDLLGFLDNNSLDQVSLFGWSMGAFLAADFSAAFPARIKELFFTGIRRKFPKDILEDVKLKIKKNWKAYLYRFYPDSFSAFDQDALAWFRKHLLKEYLSSMKPGELIAGLDYLAGARLKPQSLAGVKKITIFHGCEDKIAPFSEARSISRSLPGSKFVSFPGAGHAVFLNSNFIQKFSHE